MLHNLEKSLLCSTGREVCKQISGLFLALASTLFTTKQQGALWQRAAFPKTCFNTFAANYLNTKGH